MTKQHKTDLILEETQNELQETKATLQETKNKLEVTHNTLQVSLAKTANLEAITKKMQAELALIMSCLGGLEKLSLCINFTKTHILSNN
jgi:uncharacterized protein YciW